MKLFNLLPEITFLGVFNHLEQDVNPRMLQWLAIFSISVQDMFYRYTGSLRYEGANLWNKLPNEYDSYKLFKKQISDTDLAGRYMS